MILIVFPLLVVCTADAAAPLWRGFDFAWQRELLGFSTPHRLGSFNSRLTAKFANITFTPGVWCGV